jgi:putative acetyltransferase
MNIGICEMTTDHYDEVLALWQATEGVGLNESDTREQIASYLARNPGLSLIARSEARIIGAVLCGHDGRRGYLHHLAVAPEWRRQGLGRRMVETCLGNLAGLGIQKCNIFLYTDNDSGEQFWRCGGWKQRTDLKILQRGTAPGRA